MDNSSVLFEFWTFFRISIPDMGSLKANVQFLARDSMLSALDAIARPSVRLSVSPRNRRR